MKLSEPEMRAMRGAKIAMIFQEPMTSLNPVFTIGSQIGEAVRLHQHTARRETLERTIEALRLVGIADPERRVNDYPHQLSGGMRQRVMIAMALACEPKLLIADEPTTALDVTIQAQILDLIRELQVRLELAVILVTHDLGIVAQYADDVTILYAARVMEQAPSADCSAIRSIPTRAACSNPFPAPTAIVITACARSREPSRTRFIRRRDVGFIRAARW